MGANVISLDGRFGTSFTFEDQDILTYSLTFEDQDAPTYPVRARFGSRLRAFVKAAPEYGYQWVVSLGDSPKSSATASGSALNWFSPAIALGKGPMTAEIVSGISPSRVSATGFVKFVLSGESRKKLTITRQP